MFVVTGGLNSNVVFTYCGLRCRYHRGVGFGDGDESEDAMDMVLTIRVSVWCQCDVYQPLHSHLWLQKHDGDNVKHENEKLIRSLCDAVDGVVMPVTDGLTALAELRSRAGSYCDHSARYRTRLLYTPTTARSVDLTAVV